MLPLNLNLLISTTTILTILLLAVSSDALDNSMNVKTDEPNEMSNNQNATSDTPLLSSKDGARVLQRGKRYLDFTKGSRMSWRTSGKNNILTINTLWGYGYAFRVNFPFPDKKDRRRPFFKRDIFRGIEDVLDGHGFDGRACLLKAYCNAHLEVDSAESGGMLFKLLKMVLSLDSQDKRHLPYLRTENCHQILHNHCPLSFNNISPYTDDV